MSSLVIYCDITSVSVHCCYILSGTDAHHSEPITIRSMMFKISNLIASTCKHMQKQLKILLS